MRLALILLLLSACTAAGPAFRGIDPVTRSAEGSRFVIRQNGDMAEVIRTNPEVLPRFEVTARRAAIAVQAHSGCEPKWIEGDPAMMLIGMSCNGAKPPKKPKRRASFTCDVLHAYTLRSMGIVDVGLECYRD